MENITAVTVYKNSALIKTLTQCTHNTYNTNMHNLNANGNINANESSINKPIICRKNMHFIIDGEIDNQPAKYDRASVILIEEGNINNPTVLLFYNQKWNTYVEPGGRIDKVNDDFDITMMKTAQRELMEETLNSININDYEFKNTSYVDFYDDKTHLCSRVFIVGIKRNNFNEKIYYENQNLISKHVVPAIWKETTKVKRFTLKNIEQCIDDMQYNYYEYENLQCENKDGEICNIYYKTIGILQKIINKQIIQKILKKPKEMIEFKNNNISVKKKFLMGTKTFEIINY